MAMQYKGEDLDLRVPHSRAPRESYVADYDAPLGNGRWSRLQAAATASGEPLWVDEVLLACCNYAFDVAQANGAAEVNLEHLVNALTRVDTAARMLEARGVREGQLRRESAALIASEIPAANAGDALAPRRSPDLEDVLRRSAEMASRRGAPAGVEDVLWVLLHTNRDLPVLHLLRRTWPDWQRADWSRLRELPPADPLPARSTALIAGEGVHARMAGFEDSLRLMQAEFASERKALVELVRDIQRDVVAQRGDGAAFRNDLGQRLEMLERAVQMRADAARIPTQIAERMATLEKAVHSGLGEGARNWSHLGQRLAALEAGLADRRDGGAGEILADRVAALERAVQASLADSSRTSVMLGQRLAGFERLIGEGGTALVPEQLGNRLGHIERRLQSASEEGHLQWSELTTRLGELGGHVDRMRAESGKVGAEVASQLKALEGRLAGGDAAGVGSFAERLAGLERAVRSGFGEATQMVSQIADRLQGVERGLVERPRDEGEALLILEDRLGSMERMLEARAQQAENAANDIARRLDAFQQRSPAEGGLDTQSLVSPLAARLESLEGNSVGRAEALHGSLGDINTRLAALEERMRTDALVNEEALRGRDQDFDFIYSEIKQLGQSQATLNSAVNDWRNESQTHFGTLASRLDTLRIGLPAGGAAEAAVPTTVPFELPAVVKGRNGAGAAVHASARGPEAAGDSVSADDYALPPEPERGFWFWLFGTSSIARANRENDLQVNRMRQNIRDARERRRTQV